MGCNRLIVHIQRCSRRIGASVKSSNLMNKTIFSEVGNRFVLCELFLIELMKKRSNFEQQESPGEYVTRDH